MNMYKRRPTEHTEYTEKKIQGKTSVSFCVFCGLYMFCELFFKEDKNRSIK
jgi:hypothetical protein